MTTRGESMITIHDVAKRLGEFSYPDEIAAQFAILGIHGNPDCSSSCPIANLIVRTVDDVEDWDDVAVSATEIQGAEEVAGMPEAGRRFVHRFDDYAYPELIEER
jgi:hypothetical protein